MTISEEIDDLMNGYWTWLKDSTYLRNVGSDYVVVTTPFLDHHNDNYQIYVSKKGTGYKLTDDGYVISDLKMSGCEISSGKRKEILDTITRTFGITMEGDAMTVVSDVSDFASSKHDLIQAMQAVGDLYYTSKSTVVSMFCEDVSEWLMSTGIKSTAKISLKGHVYYHHIDFILPDKQRDGPKRILQTMGTPAKNKMADLLLMKEDLGDTIELNVFLNDEGAGERSIDSLQQFGTEHGINTMLWSQRQDYVEQLS